MICTALELKARQYSSASELLAAAAKRRKMLYGPADRPPVTRQAPAVETVTVTVIYDLRPEWKRKTIQFDAHVAAFAPYRKDRGRKWGAYIARRALEMGLTYQDMMGRSRQHHIVHARSVIMWEIHRSGQKSLPEIGALFDGRDHTTVMHCIRRAEARIGNEKAKAQLQARRETRAAWARRNGRAL